MMAILARASIDGAILVALVWLAARALRLSPAVRCALWWCAGAKFVLALAWITPIPVPVLPAEGAPVHRALPAAGQRSLPSMPAPSGSPIGVRGVASGVREWTSFAAIAWTAGLGLVTVAALRRWRATSRLRRSSDAAAAEVQQAARQLAARLGMRRVPEVRVSSAIETPLVTGLVRPVVLLPSGRFDALTPRQQQMALCHELVHLERADLVLGCVPALAERLFFFHPLAHVASREYAIAREAACDAAVVDALDVAPREYGELLLALGVAQPRTSVAAAGAAGSFQLLKRRIAMLQDEPGRRPRSTFLAVAVLGLAAAAMVPLQLVARPAQTGREAALENRTMAQAPAAERRAFEQDAIERSVSSAEEVEVQRADREARYVLLEEDHQISSGDEADASRAKRHQQNGEPLLWFERNGREYVIRDRGLLDLARSILAPLAEARFDHEAIAQLVKSLDIDALVAQGRLMAEQGALAAADGKAVAEAAIAGAQIGALVSEQVARALAESGAAIAGAQDRALDAQRRSLDDSRGQIEGQMRELERRLERDLGDQMRDLEERLRALERPIREMTAPLERLDRDMAGLHLSEDVVRRVKESIRRLVDDAIKSGLAKPVR
jgi:beta-lactamase regulating signal transducer with metallopeptidase domain